MFQDLTSKQIDKIASTLLSTAVLSAATLVFGQVTTDKPYSVLLAILGVLLWGWLIVLAGMLMQIGTRRTKGI